MPLPIGAEVMLEGGLGDEVDVDVRAKDFMVDAAEFEVHGAATGIACGVGDGEACERDVEVDAAALPLAASAAFSASCAPLLSPPSICWTVVRPGGVCCSCSFFFTSSRRTSGSSSSGGWRISSTGVVSSSSSFSGFACAR